MMDEAAVKKKIWQVIGSGLKRVTEDSLTSANGDYDPARVVGYLVVILGAFVFFGSSVYDTVANKHFDYGGFASGMSGVAIAIASAAAGVWIKKSAEKPYAPPVVSEVPDTTQTADNPSQPKN